MNTIKSNNDEEYIITKMGNWMIEKNKSHFSKGQSNDDKISQLFYLELSYNAFAGPYRSARFLIPMSEF